MHTVDDGTGVISCSCWKTPYGDKDLDTLPQLSSKFSCVKMTTSFLLFFISCMAF